MGVAHSRCEASPYERMKPMNDHVLQALRAAGFDVRPTAALDRDGAFFALTEDALYYLDDRKKSAVNLRDITRIHSDRDGILRVETGASTAITAPLVGFEVARVQHFFAEVRHATARAKTLPPPPTTTTASPWKTGWAAASETIPAPSPTPQDTTAAAPPATVTPLGGHSTPTPPTPEPRLAPEATATPARPDTPSSAPERPSSLSAVAPIETVRVRPTAVPEVRAPEAGAEVPTPPSAPTAAPSEAPVPEASGHPSAREPIRITSVPAPKTAPREDVTPLSTPPSAPLIEGAARFKPEPLARFAPTLQLLAVLMGLTGVGVGALEWRAGAPLSGLWTLGVGGVGAFALYVFAAVVRVVAGISDHLRRPQETRLPKSQKFTSQDDA